MGAAKVFDENYQRRSATEPALRRSCLDGQ